MPGSRVWPWARAPALPRPRPSFTTARNSAFNQPTDWGGATGDRRESKCVTTGCTAWRSPWLSPRFLRKTDAAKLTPLPSERGRKNAARGQSFRFHRLAFLIHGLEPLAVQKHIVGIPGQLAGCAPATKIDFAAPQWSPVALIFELAASKVCLQRAGLPSRAEA